MNNGYNAHYNSADSGRDGFDSHEVLFVCTPVNLPPCVGYLRMKMELCYVQEKDVVVYYRGNE